MESIAHLFPLEGNLTQEILDKAVRIDVQNCYGALTLKEALEKIGTPEALEAIHHITWGTDFGFIWTSPISDHTCLKKLHYISTNEDFNFFEARTPKKVTFIIKEN